MDADSAVVFAKAQPATSAADASLAFMLE